MNDKSTLDQLNAALARLKGVQDAREGVTIPPPNYCEETKPSKMLRAAWLEGWHSVSNTTTPPAPAKEEKEEKE